MHGIRRDFAYALRSLIKAPRFTVAVIVTLALGLGANTAVFSVLDAALLTPLPYPEPERLARVYLERNGERNYLPGAAFLDLRQSSRTMDMACVYTYAELSADLTDRDQPERVRRTRVSANYFRVMGVLPALGRPFDPEEERGADARLAIVSDRIYREYLGGSSDAIGRTLSIDSIPHRVVGVLPASFEDPLQPGVQVWTPEDLQINDTNSWGNNRLSIIARLAPGVSIDQARAEGGVLVERQAPHYGPRVTRRIDIQPLQADIVGPAGSMLYVLFGAVALLLLLACVNVASLMLARATARGQEMAVRSALGSSRWGIIRQLLVESLALSGAGGLAGLLLAYGVSRALLAASPVAIVQAGRNAFDPTVFAYGLAAAVVSGVAFGLAPALHASRPDLERVLRENGRGGTGSKRQTRLWNVLVVAQVGVALVLLIGAGLLLKGFAKLRAVNLGLEPANVLTFRVNLPAGRYGEAERRQQFHLRLQERLAAIAGVRAVGAVSRLPVTGSYHSWPVRLPGAERAALHPEQRTIEGQYFEALQIPVLRGRVFGPEDGPTAERRVVISRSVADALFPDADPVGRQIQVTGLVARVIGVVGDLSLNARGTRAPAVYHSHSQFADNRNWMLTQVVSTTPGAHVLEGARRELAAIDPALVLYEPQQLDEVVGHGRASERFALQLIGAFAMLALTLAGIGIYGVLSYAVTSRRAEIGIRMALGAPQSAVRGMILLRGVRLATAGLACGVAGALALTRALQSLVFDVSLSDPAVFGLAAAILGLTALAAAWLPARTAIRVNPVETLAR